MAGLTHQQFCDLANRYGFEGHKFTPKELTQLEEHLTDHPPGAYGEIAADCMEIAQLLRMAGVLTKDES